MSRSPDRRKVSITGYRKERLLLYALLLFVVPIALATLLATFRQPPEPISRSAKDLVVERAKRVGNFPAAPGTHKVVRVISGDTVDIRAPGDGVVRARLRCIVSPTRGEPLALASKRHLAKLILGRIVTVETEGRDEQGRLLASVTTSQGDINRKMLEDGFARLTRQEMIKSQPPELALKNCDPSYYETEQKARTAQVGVWKL
ncbi:MAG: thermonuclease family protein [Pseudomonadota bacterium]